jgi:hypothetical protein
MRMMRRLQGGAPADGAAREAGGGLTRRGLFGAACAGCVAVQQGLGVTLAQAQAPAGAARQRPGSLPPGAG